MAIHAGREALAIADRLSLDDVRSHALNSVGMARFYLGDPDGIADLERSVEIALAAGSHLASISYNNLAAMHRCAGDVRRDQELREEGLRLAERFGDGRTVRFLRGALIEHAYFGGRWHDALREADRFVAECEAGSPHYLEANAHWIRALLRLARDEGERAAADALRADELAREAKDPQSLLPALGIHLRVELELGRLERAAALSAELLRKHPNVAPLPPAIELAWTAERLETADAVREWIEAIVVQSAWNDAALAILDGELEKAADLFAKIGSLPDEARARLRAAERLVAAGRRAEADVQLQQALAFYRSVGATRHIREGEALLAAAS